MQRYGDKPSQPLELPGLGTDGEQLMLRAREWVAGHPDEWGYYMQLARLESIHAPASPNYLLQALRHRYHVSIANSLASALARIALEQDYKLRFRLAKSKVDGFTEAAL